MTRKRVGNVAVNLRILLRELGDRIGPEIDLVRAVYLHPSVIDEITVRAHPPYVSEVGCRPSREIHHQLPRNPSPFYQRQRDVVLSQQGQHSLGDPAAMAKLDSDAQIRWRVADEIYQRWQLARLEVRPRLYQHGPQLVTQISHTVEKDL